MILGVQIFCPKMNGIKMILIKALSDIKVNRRILFQAVEQGFGKRNDNMFVYYHLEHKILVHK